MKMPFERNTAFLDDREGELQWATLWFVGIAQSLVHGGLPSTSYVANGMFVLLLSRVLLGCWVAAQPAPLMPPDRPPRLVFLAFFPLSVLYLTLASLANWTGRPANRWLDELVWGLLCLLLGVYWWRRTWILSRLSVPGHDLRSAL